MNFTVTSLVGNNNLYLIKVEVKRNERNEWKKANETHARALLRKQFVDTPKKGRRPNRKKNSKTATATHNYRRNTTRVKQHKIIVLSIIHDVVGCNARPGQAKLGHANRPGKPYAISQRRQCQSSQPTEPTQPAPASNVGYLNR